MGTAESDVPWLSDDELATWLAFTTSSGRLLSALEQQLQRDAGIPHAWYGLLAILSNQPERTARQSDLGATALFSLSRLSHAVSRLEQRGWLSRRLDPDDRRVSLVTLTDEGVAALALAAPGHVREVRRLFLSRLTPEQGVALRDACEAVLAGLPAEPEGLRAPGRD